ncbi:hypothetical protein N9Y00_07075 [Tateyamaria sp.]|nr:hypothetical protein [Tateyamaria sp.]
MARDHRTDGDYRNCNQNDGGYEMTPADRAKYLENRRQRVHYAIQAKRTLGRWVPQTGPIEDAERILNQKRHELINFRAGDDCKPSEVQNLMVTLRVTNNLERTLETFSQPDPRRRRRMMTARRIAHRLGYLEERADWMEKQCRWRARYGEDADQHIWVTLKDLKWSSGINLNAGSRVYYDDNGCFYTGAHRSIQISAEEAEQIGVKRLT